MTKINGRREACALCLCCCHQIDLIRILRSMLIVGKFYAAHQTHCNTLEFSSCMWADETCIYAAFNGYLCSTCKLSLKQLHGDMLRSRIVTGILSDAIHYITDSQKGHPHKWPGQCDPQEHLSVPEVLCSWPANHKICSSCCFGPAELPELRMYFAYQYARDSSWMIEHKRQNRLPIPVELPQEVQAACKISPCWQSQGAAYHCHFGLDCCHGDTVMVETLLSTDPRPVSMT